VRATRAGDTLHIRVQGADGAAALKELLKALPQYREEMQKYSLHLDMSNAINKAFSKTVENCTKAEQVGRRWAQCGAGLLLSPGGRVGSINLPGSSAGSPL
jgi:hypothetical protein